MLERSVISGNLLWFRLFWFPVGGEYDSGYCPDEEAGMYGLFAGFA